MKLTVTSKAGIWLLQLSAIVALLIISLSFKPFSINADILSLFPQKEDSRWQAAQQHLNADLGKNLVYLVGHEDKARAIEAASVLRTQLSDTEAFTTVFFRLDDLPTLNDIALSYDGANFQFLDDQIKSALKDNDREGLFARQFQLLNQTLSVIDNSLIENDRFLTLTGYVSRSPFLESSLFVLDEKYLAVMHENKTFVLVNATLKADSLNVDSAITLVKQLDNLSLLDDAQYLRNGAVLYSAEAAENGQFEMKLFSSLSIVALIALLLITFRSLVAIFSTIVVIGVAALWGGTALVLIFEEVNILAFVFALTLIGVASDYSFHALTELQTKDKKTVNPLSKIKYSLLLSFLTTSVGYMLLAMSPLAIFKQVSIFTIAGLTGALLTVWLLFPLIHNLLNTTESQKRVFVQLNAFHRNIIDLISKRKILASLIIIAFVSPLLLSHFNDNPKSFYRASPKLITNEQQTKQILGSKTDNQFILVWGQSENQLLLNEELIVDKLNSIADEGVIANYSAVTRWLPAEETQRENFMLVKEANDMGMFKKFDELTGREHFYIVDSMYQPVLLQTWRKTPIGHLFDKQLFEDKGNFFSVIRLSGIKDKLAIKTAVESSAFARFIDPVTDAEAQLGHFRLVLQWVFLAAFFAAFIVFFFRYGYKRCITGVLVPTLSFFIALAFSALVQSDLSIFNLVAGLVIFALGLDYSIFYAEHGFKPEVSQTTGLSALSSVFVFAILALSGTPAIASFGITVFIGILITFLLSPLVTIIKS